MRKSSSKLRRVLNSVSEGTRHAYRRRALETERMFRVRGVQERKWEKLFFSAFGKMLRRHGLSMYKDANSGVRYLLRIGGFEVCYFTMRVIKDTKKVSAVVEEFQGLVGGTSGINKTREITGKPWNIFLVDSIVAAAHRAGLDRVMLRDVETMHYYRSPYVLYPEMYISYNLREKRNAIRGRMKRLYYETVEKCSFNKKEGDYFVRDFP